MRTLRTIATIAAAGALSVAGMLVAAGPAAACEPTHTGELGDGTPIYFGCEIPIDGGDLEQPPLYPQMATVTFAR